MYYAEKLKCFVVATLEQTTRYIHIMGGKQYRLVQKLSAATKIATRDIANDLIYYYRSSTGDTRDLVIIPLEVTYELIDERI